MTTTTIYQPGDWVIYQPPQGARHRRLSGWHFKVTAVEGDILYLHEDVWNTNVVTRAAWVCPE